MTRQWSNANITVIRMKNAQAESALWIGGLVAGGLMWLVACIVGSSAPTVSLQKESAGQLWLSGAGEGFLKVQAPYSGKR